eukprot:6005098-Prymnesium_polylepis.1
MGSSIQQRQTEEQTDRRPEKSEANSPAAQAARSRARHRQRGGSKFPAAPSCVSEALGWRGGQSRPRPVPKEQKAREAEGGQCT